MKIRDAKFNLGDVVRHRTLPFRGVVFDVDAEYARTEEWYQSLPPEIRPDKNQPFYHLVAENDEKGYVAYVSEANLVVDTSGEPLRNPQVGEIFTLSENGHLSPRYSVCH
ncbi:heat shock protein HspQ [Martelella endophytica]|uniref:Heat shock protein HspQ n=1 Tax=Martelella endophytica TaxID=1486262 RepID=A0A0D5LW70_MAREN|nr:heat shock protein HspQ [Martelella endophytica]AJY48281.1 DNA-binding protein [Martelella endophytica]